MRGASRCLPLLAEPAGELAADAIEQPGCVSGAPNSDEVEILLLADLQPQQIEAGGKGLEQGHEPLRKTDPTPHAAIGQRLLKADQISCSSGGFGSGCHA